MSGIDGLGSVLGVLGFNSIEETNFVSRRIFCDISKERGLIIIKIKRGNTHIPKLLRFSIPQGATLENTTQEYPELPDLILYNPTKGYLIDVSKLGPSKTQTISIKYEKDVTSKIFEEIKIEDDGESVRVVNSLNAKFIRYTVTTRVLLPIYLKNIIDLDGKSFKEYLENKLEISDENGNKLKFLPNYHVYLRGTQLEIEIAWCVDLEPNCIRHFQITIIES